MEDGELQRLVEASGARIRELLALFARLDGRVHQLERQAIETNRALLAISTLERRLAALEQFLDKLAAALPSRGMSQERERRVVRAARSNATAARSRKRR